MVNSSAPIEWAVLKYFAGDPDEHGVRGSPPTQFPDLMAALRELSEEFRGETRSPRALAVSRRAWMLASSAP